MQMVIKCADIGHLAAAHHTHRQWSYKLEEEFFRQVHAHLVCFMTMQKQFNKNNNNVSIIIIFPVSLLVFCRLNTTLCMALERSVQLIISLAHSQRHNTGHLWFGVLAASWLERADVSKPEKIQQEAQIMGATTVAYESRCSNLWNDTQMQQALYVAKVPHTTCIHPRDSSQASRYGLACAGGQGTSFGIADQSPHGQGPARGHDQIPGTSPNPNLPQIKQMPASIACATAFEGFTSQVLWGRAQGELDVR